MPNIEIKIGKKETVKGQAPTTEILDRQQQEAGRPSIQSQAVNTALISAGKQVLTQGVNQFAELTGNYVAAERFNTALSIGSDIAILSTGPVGVIAVTAKYGINIANSFVKQIKANRNIDLQRQRAGFISTQGSRYK